jgi:hypothetical protein
MNCLQKSGPLGIDAIGKIVALVVWMAIDLIVKQQSIALRKPSKDQRMMEHVDVIVGAVHAKKGVPDQQMLICHGLKNDSEPLSIPAILPLPCKREVLPLPMHAVNTSYHPQKSSSLIDR